MSLVGPLICYLAVELKRWLEDEGAHTSCDYQIVHPADQILTTLDQGFDRFRLSNLNLNKVGCLVASDRSLDFLQNCFASFLCAIRNDYIVSTSDSSQNSCSTNSTCSLQSWIAQNSLVGI